MCTVLLPPGDKPVAVNKYIIYHTTLTRDKHPCPEGIRTHNPSKRAAAEPRLRLCGRWDRHI